MNDKIKFGCEIEFLSKNKLQLFIDRFKKYYPNYNVHKDNNLYEVTSPILYKNDLNEFKNVLTIIKIFGGYIDESMGAHIHFDHSILKDENIVTFLKLWYCFEDIIYQFSYGEFDHLRRSGLTFAQKLGNLIPEKIERYEKNKSLKVFSEIDRKRGLNITNHILRDLNYYKGDTYEIRVPNGTLCFDIWKNNIEFFYLLFNYLDIEIIDYIYSQGKVKNNEENAKILQKMIYKDEDNNFMKQYNGFYIK